MIDTMDDWKQAAMYFYIATVIIAIVLVFVFVGLKIYNCNHNPEKPTYMDIAVSDEEEIALVKEEEIELGEITEENEEDEEETKSQTL